MHPPNDAGVGQAKLAAGDTALTNNEYCDGCTFDDSSLTMTFHDMLGPPSLTPNLTRTT